MAIYADFILAINIRKDEPYWQVARRAKQYIGRYIAEAASEFYKDTKDWYRFMLSGVLEPKPMTQQVPGPYYSNQRGKTP